MRESGWKRGEGAGGERGRALLAGYKGQGLFRVWVGAWVRALCFLMNISVLSTCTSPPRRAGRFTGPHARCAESDAKQESQHESGACRGLSGGLHGVNDTRERASAAGAGEGRARWSGSAC